MPRSSITSSKTMLALVPLPSCARRAEQEVAAHREMREQARLLEDISERAFVGRQERAVFDPARPRRRSRRPPLMRRRPAMQRRTVVLPQPDGPNRAVTPLAGAVKPASSANLPMLPRNCGPDRVSSAHAPARAKRFSSRIIARMTAKAKATMPPASMFASRHRIVSTKSKIARRHDPGPARNVAADHQDHAELADRMGEAEHRAGQQAGARKRQRDGPEGARGRSAQGAMRPRAAGRRRRRRRCGSAARQTASTR